ncbi:MAG: hypothetical protein WB711_25210 [Terriglobales bacterium]
MTCEEFGRVLPELGSGCGKEHLKSCSTCSELVADLDAISQEARLLQGSEDPSPWVWNSIEVALRQEGLIHQPQLEYSRTHPSMRGWRLRWLVPLAATFLIVFGVLIYQRGTGEPQVAERQSPAGLVTANLQTNPNDVMAGDDLQVLKTVAERTPAMRATYEADLRSVNAYIRDAEQSAHNNPNDEVAQQYLRSAYEQKAMVYEMALDRSLP